MGANQPEEQAIENVVPGRRRDTIAPAAWITGLDRRCVVRKPDHGAGARAMEDAVSAHVRTGETSQGARSASPRSLQAWRPFARHITLHDVDGRLVDSDPAPDPLPELACQPFHVSNEQPRAVIT